GGGGGSAFHRAAGGDLRVGGRGQRGPASAGGGRGRAPGDGVRRPAGVPAGAGPGGDVHRDGAEGERGDGGDRQGARGRAERADPPGARAPARFALPRGREAGARRRLRVQSQPRGRVGGSDLPARGAALLRAGGPRVRSGDPQADGGVAGEAEGRGGLTALLARTRFTVMGRKEPYSLIYAAQVKQHLRALEQKYHPLIREG